MTNPFRVTREGLNISSVLVTSVRNQQVLVSVIREGSAFCLFFLFFHTHTHIHTPHKHTLPENKSYGKNKQNKEVLTSTRVSLLLAYKKQNPINSLNMQMGLKSLEPCSSGGWKNRRNRLVSIPVSGASGQCCVSLCVCVCLCLCLCLSANLNLQEESA